MLISEEVAWSSVSSAYRNTLVFRHTLQISFTWMLNRVGPRIDPCGTPWETVVFVNVSPHVTRKTLSLDRFQEFVIVLMKLRLNMPQQDLAYRFQVSHSTVSRIFSSWLVVMDTRLFPLLSWPEREQLWRTMPQCFMYSFGKKVSVVIDCFEVFIEKPTNLLARAQTFSSYKHHNTIKLLIGITPQGTVSYVSEAWGAELLISSWQKETDRELWLSREVASRWYGNGWPWIYNFCKCGIETSKIGDTGMYKGEESAGPGRCGKYQGYS